VTPLLNLLYDLATLAGPVLFLVLAGVMARSGRRELHVRLWNIICVLLAAMGVGIWLTTRVVSSRAGADFTARLALTAGALALATAVPFSAAFLRLFDRMRWAVAAVTAATALLLILFWSTDLAVQGMERSAYGLNVPVAGPLIPVYFAFATLCAAGLVVLHAHAFWHATGRARLQIGYFLIALLFIGLSAASTLLPTMQRESPAVFLPSLLIVIGPALITYAIIRHQLWDIRTVAHKTALWITASSVIVVPVYWGLRYILELRDVSTSQVALLATLVLLAAFGLHFRVVQPWINHRFSRGTRNPQRVVDAFNREVLNLRGVQELADLLRQTLRSAVYTTRVRLLVLASEAGDSPAGEAPGLALDEELRALFARLNREVDASALEHYQLAPPLEQKLAALLAEQQAEVAVPLVHEGTLLGLVCLGEKQHLRPYTRDDFALLERIRPPATIALSNALLYDRLHEFTVSLERRVEQRTRELSEANKKLLDLDRVKSKFFANITHELRTPLTLILAPLEDLLLKMDDRAAAEDLSIMHRNGLRLLRSINALLDLAKLDAGELRLRLGPVRLNQFAEAAVRSFRPIAARQGITLSFSPVEGDDRIIGDSEKLDLVMGNLLANAVKFTDPGGSVEVRVLDDADWLAISVKDTGIGIATEQLDRIFDRFAQVDSGTTRRYEGAGIGLALVKEITTLHRGSIAVSSRLGEGSEFRVRLPRRLPAPAEDRVEQGAAASAGCGRDEGPGTWAPLEMDAEAWVSIKHDTAAVDGVGAVTVLVVEDNADMRSYLQRRLAEHFRVVTCCNGREALERIAEQAPDLVLADVMMPEVSGVELCQRLKEDRTTSGIPVILITAHRDMDRTLEGFRSGADDYLTKPFNFQELLARIQVQLRLADMARQLARQQKGEVLNLVAAGLAHEVRNPVNAILNAAGPLADLLQLPPTDETRAGAAELLEAIRESAQRIDLLVGDVLGVSRPHPEETASWSVAEALESTLRLLRCKHCQPISVHRTFAHQAAVFGRTSQLNQVLLNLLDNAVRAAGPGGTVWVTTDQSNGTFRLRVRDNGPGVSLALRERIFDPLFTTSAAKGSTGLGLYITRRIVTEHGGRVEVRSPAEGGAEFIVELPL
jgi:signal transduction histidine kinase